MKLPGKGLSWKEFFRALKTEWAADRVSDTAAGLTFYGMLALFPFVLFLFALASLLISPEQLESMTRSLSRVAPPPVAQILGERLHALASNPRPGLLTIGVLGALWSASGGIAALQRMLNVVYDVDEHRPFWKTRGISLGMTIVTAVLALVAAAVAILLPPIAGRLGGGVATAATWARLPIAGILMMLLWALLYWALPAVEQRFRFLTLGSVVAVVLWVVASWGFSVYVTHFGKFDATYGALGGIIVLLLWMWISAQVLLLGAEINAVIEHASPEGKRRGAKSLADTGASEPKGEKQRREREAPQREPSPEERPTLH